MGGGAERGGGDGGGKIKGNLACVCRIVREGGGHGFFFRWLAGTNPQILVVSVNFLEEKYFVLRMH